MAEQEIANTKEQNRLELERMQAQMAHNQQRLENQTHQLHNTIGQANENREKAKESDNKKGGSCIYFLVDFCSILMSLKTLKSI